MPVWSVLNKPMQPDKSLGTFSCHLLKKSHQKKFEKITIGTCCMVDRAAPVAVTPMQALG